jgi:predicted RNA-binding protein with RPS1 domain
MTRFDELSFDGLDVDDVVTGEVVSVVPFGTFVRIATDADGLLHGVTGHEIGGDVTVRILEIDRERRRASLAPA